MSILEKVNARIKEAMKAQDKPLLAALRGISSELVKEEKATSTTLTDEQEIKILTKLAKQRADAAELYKEGNRPELEAVEVYQRSVIGDYLPQQVDSAIVTAFIAKLVVSGVDNTGKIMGALTQEFKGQAVDMKAASKIVAALLKEHQEAK